jgi:hypothetical protein
MPNVRAERAAAGGAAWPWKGQCTYWTWTCHGAWPGAVRSSEGLGPTAAPYQLNSALADELQKLTGRADLTKRLA